MSMNFHEIAAEADRALEEYDRAREAADQAAAAYQQKNFIRQLVGNWETRPAPPMRTLIAVFARAGGACEDCLTDTQEWIVHADCDFGDRYGTEFGREAPGDIVILCEECLLARHTGPAGEFYDDSDEAADQRSRFEDAMAKDQED